MSRTEYVLMLLGMLLALLLILCLSGCSQFAQHEKSIYHHSDGKSCLLVIDGKLIKQGSQESSTWDVDGCDFTVDSEDQPTPPKKQ